MKKTKFSNKYVNMKNFKLSNFKEFKTSILGLFLLGLNVWAFVKLEGYSFVSFLILLGVSVGFLFSPDSVITALKRVLKNIMDVILRKTGSNDN